MIQHARVHRCGSESIIEIFLNKSLRLPKKSTSEAKCTTPRAAEGLVLP